MYSSSGSHVCTNCPAGKHTPDDGLGNCWTCPTGKYAEAGSPACTNCPPGYYQPFNGTSECVSCPMGKFSPVEGQHECIGICPRGKYSELTWDHCKQCPDGK